MFTTREWDVICFLLILVSNWAMDSIKFRYRQSIFYRWAWLRETRFFGYREFWRSDATTAYRKYVDGNPAKGRKKIGVIVIPEAFYNGWHFWKMIMVGGIIALVSDHWVHFVAGSILWILAWWLMYDKLYNTGANGAP